MFKKSLVSLVLAMSLLSSSVVRADDENVTVFGVNMSSTSLGWVLIVGGAATGATAQLPAVKSTTGGQILNIVGGVINTAGTLVTLGTIKLGGKKIGAVLSGEEVQKAVARECRVISDKPSVANHSPLASIANKFDMYRAQSEASRVKSSCTLMNSVAARVNELKKDKVSEYDVKFAKDIAGKADLSKNDAIVIRNLFHVYGLGSENRI